MTTRGELYQSLAEARDEPAFQVRYEHEDERDWVLMFGDSEDEVVKRFNELVNQDGKRKDVPVVIDVQEYIA